MSEETEKKTGNGVRWKLLVGLLAVPWLALLALHVVPALDRFSFATGFAGVGAVFVSLLLAALWLLGLSRLAWRERWRGLSVLGGLLVLAGAAVRKDGHMGDFLPQLAWRWQPKPGEAVAPLVVATRSGERALRFTTDGAEDAPKFLGKSGTALDPAPQLPAGWEARPPRELWRREVGLGWSGFAVAGDFAVTQEQRGAEEVTVAYEKRTGAPLWVHAEKARFSEAMGGDGPRATPTAHDGKVYAMGATGILVCLEGATGKLRWRRDTLAEAGHANLMWAKSCSPVIAGDKVVVTLGKGPQCLAAYRIEDGEPAWRSGPGEASYGSPVLVGTPGGAQLLCVFSDRAAGFDPATGKELWSWTEGFRGAPANVANPVFLPPNRVLVGIGYGVGSTMLQTEAGKPPVIVWESLRMKPKFTNFVVRGNRAWALDEGRLACLDLDTGKSLWRGSSYGHGQMLGAGAVLIVQSERGEVVLAAADDQEERVLARIPALSSKTWNQPCLAGTLLLVRNDREAVCFELAPAVP
jgi:outer membrane protein assembly factor BamB